MTTPIKIFGVTVVGALMLMTAFAFFYTAHANPSFFLRKATNTSFASTTVVYQTAGLATTTLVMDLGASGAQAADTATLLQQFIGSTTAATQKTTIEYSAGQSGVDCVANENACDWYLGLATTTLAQGNRAGGLAPVSSTTLNILTIPTPTRYVRVVFTIPTAGVPGAIYAELVAKRQAN